MDGEGVVTGLGLLRLSQLPSKWIDDVWENNFLDTADTWPVDEVPPHDVIAGLSQLAEGLLQWKPRSDEFWIHLAANSIPVRAVIPLLHYFMDSMLDKPEASALASTCYCALLNIPGSGAHSAFNEMVFRTSTKIIRRWVSSADGKAESPMKPAGTKRTASSPAQGEPTKHRRGGKQKAQKFVEDDDLSTAQSLPSHTVVALLREYVQTLTQFSGDSNGDGAEEVIQLLVEVSRMQWTRECQDPIEGQMEAALAGQGDSTPRALAYAGLRTLYNGAAEVEVAVCRGLLQSITMRNRAGMSNGASIPKAVNTTRNAAVEFISYLVRTSANAGSVRLLVQHACTKVSDKAEYRSAVADSASKIILSIVEHHPDAGSELLSWVAKLSRNGKVGYRNFAIELITCILRSSISTSTALSHTAEFIDIMVSRASDKAPVVRTRALTSIGATVALAAESDREGSVFSEFATRYKALSVSDPADRRSSSFSDTITRRTQDEKSTVRKAAIQVLEVFATTLATMPSAAQLKAFRNACNDISVNVRKQSVSSFTNVLEANPTSRELRASWLDAVLPLVIDAEETVRTKCTQLLQGFLLAPITAPSTCSPQHCELGWLLLELIDQKQDLRRYLQRLCALWENSGALTPALFKRLGDHVCDQSTTGGWSLFNEIAARKPKQVDTGKITAAWSGCSLDDLTTVTHLLAIVGHCVERIPEETLSEIAEELRARLVQFSVPVSAVPGMLHCLERISSVGASGQPMDTFLAKLMQVAESMLAAVSLSGESDTVYDEVALARQIFTFGETALLCPTAVNRRHVLIIQALVAPVIPTHDGDAREAHPPAVRAHAFLCIGKLCLQDEELAKQSIASMAHELEVCSDPAVRNNIVVVITDLCVRHPNAIQKYLPNLALCLKDPTALVRRQTITLLTRLLKEDFIKLRFGLIFRLIMTIVDTDESVRDLAQFCVINILKVKDDSLFYSHFVECIFHFNTVRDHQIYNRFPQRDREIELFTLAGPENQKKRETLYTLMLQHSSEVERIQLTQKLCQEVLGGVADGSLPFTDGVKDVLQDTLRILASPDIKVQSKCAAEEEEDARVVAASKAKNALVSKIVRKNVVENIVPIVIGLKGFLEYQRSPLMKGLMVYLREVMKDFSTEIADVMAADRQLADEIEFDLRKFDEEQQRAAAIAAAEEAEASAAAAAAGGSPARQLPTGKSPAKSQRRRSSLHHPTPTGSPLLSPSLFASFGTPGSPAFAVPKLRGQNSQARSRLASATSASAVARTAQTPASAGGSPAARAASPGDPLLAAGPSAINPMAWVRTPSSKRSSLSAATRGGHEIETIRLRTPLASHVESAGQWQVDPPKFPGVPQSKRDREDDTAEEEADDLIADENADANVTKAPLPPPKKQQLSKAQLRKRNVELSKLTVALTEKRMELECQVDAENYFEAERLKAEIEELNARRTELAV